jgi:hypothetical protein
MTGFSHPARSRSVTAAAGFGRRVRRFRALKRSPTLPDEKTVERSLLPDETENGGFPEPPATEPVRVVSARHDACGAETRVRLPGVVPAHAVRRLRCAGCEQAFETDRVEEIGVEAAAPAAAEPPTRRRPFGFDPQSRGWRLASIPIAAALVVAGLLLLQGGDDDSSQPKSGGPNAERSKPKDAGGNGAGGAGKPAKNTKLVRGSAFSLALPAGWEQVEPGNGATFAAVAGDGGADATLWIEEDPELEFPAFVNRSLSQLEALAGSARVVERTPAPTPEGTVVVLAADSPPGQPSYEVTLRAAGPYRYYLATSIQPDASAKAIEGADVISGSFTPEAGD